MSSAATLAVRDDNGAETLDRMARAIDALDGIVAGWDDAQIGTVQALKSAIEALNKEAFARLIRALKDNPAARGPLRAAVADPVVHGVLSFHGLLRESLQLRLERALEEVRPFMRGHGGDVELVRVEPPDAIDIRLTGACHGCPASSETLRHGVESAVRKHCPEIVHIRQVSRGAASAGAGHVVSPFANAAAELGWTEAARLDEIPEGGIVERKIAGRSVLLSQREGRVSCLDNACAHLGMPLEMGEVADGIITCSYHGFRYLLETGECLTAPEVQLVVHATRVHGGRVSVRLEA